MLDIKLIREQADYVRERLASRGAGDEQKLDEIIALDKARRGHLSEVETLKEQRNRASKEIGALIGQKKMTEAETRKTEVRTMGERISTLDKEVAGIETKLGVIVLRQFARPELEESPAHCVGPRDRVQDPDGALGGYDRG